MSDRDVIVCQEELKGFPAVQMVFKRVMLRPGTLIGVSVSDVGEDTSDVALTLTDTDSGQEAAVRFDLRVEAETIFNHREIDRQSFRNSDGSYEDYLERVYAYVIMTEGVLTLENAGTEVNIYLKLRTYDDMVTMEREEAESYFVITSP